MMRKAVGIRELKNHLSRYVKEVKDGDEILVSDRGKIVARIVLVGGTSEGTRLQNMLLKLSAEGKIILPRNEEPRSRAARYLIVRSYYFHIRSLTPQQAARNALAIRFIKKQRAPTEEKR